MRKQSGSVAALFDQGKVNLVLIGSGPGLPDLQGPACNFAELDGCDK